MVDREKLLKIHKNRFVKFMTAVVAFSVTYALVLPAITIDRETADAEPGIVLEENAETTFGAEYPETVGEEPEKVSETVPEYTEVQEEDMETVFTDHLEYRNDQYVFTVKSDQEVFTGQQELVVKRIEENKEKEYSEKLAEVFKDEKILSADIYETGIKEDDVVHPVSGKVMVSWKPENVEEPDEGNNLRLLICNQNNEFKEIKNSDEKQNVFVDVKDRMVREISFSADDEFKKVAFIVTEENQSSDQQMTEVFETAYPAVEFEGKTDGVSVSVSAPEGAFPAGTKMSVKAVATSDVMNTVNKTVDGEVQAVQAVDIVFTDPEGNEIEPKKAIRVSLVSDIIKETDSQSVVHIDQEGNGSIVEQSGDSEADEIIFESDEFSIYVIVTTIEKTVLAGDGHNYHITASFGPETGIPEDAELNVEEITEGFSAYGKSYEDYVAYTENALGMKEGSSQYIRLFDISIAKDGEKIQPAEGTNVDVRIELADSSSDLLNVIHFSDGTEEGEEIQSSTENGENRSVVEFQAGSFSVYSIVDPKDPVHYEPYKLNSLEEIEEDTVYLLSYGSPDKYFTSGVNSSGAIIENSSSSAAAGWYFEKADEDGGTFYIYTLVSGTKKYIHQKEPGSNLIELADAGTAFVLSEAADKPGTFIIKHSTEDLWIQHSNGGKGIRLFKESTNTTNARIYITNNAGENHPDDPYDLDGQSFGIAYNDNSVTAAAMTAAGKTVNSQNRLEGSDLLIRADVLNNKGVLLVAENSDIQEWTFESVEKDRYYVKTVVDGSEKYLRVNNGNVTLVDRTEASVIQATPGTGANRGKWHFTVNDYSLNFAGSAANGFNAANNNNTSTWLYLVERSTLSEDDFTYYSARKISASDEILGADAEEKAQVIVYTRVWNEETSRYDYYAVDHDGSLIRVYDSGDRINWVGNQVNSALWEFTEYTNTDGSPNSYYELQNTAFSNTYLAPQSTGVIANAPVGIHMEGREEGFDYTDILAWDEKAYAYSGLKVEGNKVVSCPKDEADDFYFALVVPPVQTAEPPTTVKTVNNNEYGITMKMIDFNNPIIKEGGTERDSVQHPFFGSHAYNQDNPDQGLLSTNLTKGYPETTAKTGNAGHSLSELYNGMTTVNHLFIQSVYNESGYFEYDSTQNFASLTDNGDFKVYNQIGAIGTSTGNTRTHGQFMPYNDINEITGYAYDTHGNLITNKTDVLRRELPDNDPRKGEPLYSIPQNDADYFYGMELSASFTQTPDGVDNWGHDIIFEFTGDDDFWLYVDGELVLDLGGIHSAMPGSVNFRTGEVIIYKTRTTLYDIFKSNFEGRGITGQALTDKLNGIFETKTLSDGTVIHVFEKYTSHTMKMFYMERGAGASNLKMRFNLASVQPGTVELSKKLAGTSAETNKLIQYPYQIWYRMPVYKTENDKIVHDENGNPIIESYSDPIQLVQGETSSASAAVVYKGRRKLIPFRQNLKIDGKDYQNVFLLKAGETAVVRFPDQNCQYEIIECGLDTEVYEQVSVNGNEIEGTLYNNTDTGSEASVTERRQDFGIDYETTIDRPKAEYTNKVGPDVMRNLTLNKAVYDSEGRQLTKEETAEVEARFRFRLYLGNEFADENDLSPANMYSYYIKNPDNIYCRWNTALQKFEPVNGISEYEGPGGLEEYLETAGSEEKSAVVFTTSKNGSIANIPAGYTVEVRDLIVGTKYKIEEPDRELPKGYTRCDSDGYVRTDLEEGYVVYYTEEGTYGRHPAQGNEITAEPVSDTIVSKNESPKIEIRNQEGWGLTALKEWTDKDFFIHDPIYMAVYLNDGTGDPGTLIDGTVRRLDTDETEIYWFFQDLKVGSETYTFDKFIVREVELSGTPVVDGKTGEVTGYTGITPVAKNGTVSVSGKTFGGTERTEEYTVTYETGKSTGQNANIRTDTVTNSRPGIQIYKTDWSWNNYLEGAEFTLKDSGGTDVGAASYTSDNKGLVTTAYLNEGTFTLNEIRTPTGYAAPDEPITITVTREQPETYDLAVTAGETTYYIVLGGPEDFYMTAPASENAMARITVRNRTLQKLKVVKEGVDGNTRIRLGGVHFALYEQVRDSEGNVRPAYNPKTGYEDLVTDDEGVLTDLTTSVGPGTYYLREKAAPSGYKKLAEDLCFTIGRNGSVTINNTGYANWLTKDTSVPGMVSYLISIENTPLGITIRKTDDSGNALSGSKFVLCRKNDTGGFEYVSEYGLGENGLIDLTDKTEMTFTGMASGIYRLTESDAPAGYLILTGDIYFDVADGAVTLTDENGDAETYTDVTLRDDNTTIVVKNAPGIPLPSTGGAGTSGYTVTGMTIILAAVLLLAGRKYLNMR